MDKIVDTVLRGSKAVTAGVLAASTAYAQALDGGVTAIEWVLIVAGGLVVGVTTWAVPNKPPAQPE